MNRKRPSDSDRQLKKLDIIIGQLEEIKALIPTQGRGHTSIHVVQVQLEPKENLMPPIDHMPPVQLPATTLRARLSVVNPRKADGTRVASVTWRTSNPTDLPLEAIPDSTVLDELGAEVLDPVDNLPLKVFSTFANTPNEISGEGTITVAALGMVDCDVKIAYSDPPLGHFALVTVETPEA